MEKIKHFDKNINIENKRVILRSDFNVPIINGRIQDYTMSKKYMYHFAIQEKPLH